MHPPLNVLKGFSRRVPAGECSERWQSTFSPAVNMRKLDDQSLVLDLEATKQVGASSFEHKWLIAKHDGTELLIGQSKHFVNGVALDQDLRHRDCNLWRP